MGAVTKVDPVFAIGRRVPVVEGNALEAIKAAYNDITLAYSRAGREPALVVVTVYATQKGGQHGVA